MTATSDPLLQYLYNTGLTFLERRHPLFPRPHSHAHDAPQAAGEVVSRPLRKKGLIVYSVCVGGGDR